MMATLENPNYSRRYPLWQWTNVQFTGSGPYGLIDAFFYAKHTQVVAGTKVQFVEQSMGCPRNYTWEFPNVGPYDYIRTYSARDYYGYSAPAEKKGVLWIRNYYLEGFNIRHTWMTPLIDLTNYKNSNIVFDYCYSPHQYNTVLHSDTLEIKISDDYGVTWKTVLKKGGTDLMTIPYPTGTNNPDGLNFALQPSM